MLARESGASLTRPAAAANAAAVATRARREMARRGLRPSCDAGGTHFAGAARVSAPPAESPTHSVSAERPSSRASLAGGLRIDPVLVAVVSLALGAAAAVAPAATLTAAAVALALLSRRLGRAAVLGAAACVGVGAARASDELAEHARRFDRARELLPAPSRCAARGRVTSSPTLHGDTLRFDADLSALDCEGTGSDGPWPARLYVPSEALPRAPPPATLEVSSAMAPTPSAAPAPLARGDQFFVVADLAPVSQFRNLLLPDPRPSAARRGAVLSGGALSLELEARAYGPRSWIDRARAHVRARIVATFAAPVAGMARALVLGENDLEPDDERAFQRSGLSHLLAVSGTHLILAVLAFVRGVEALLRRWPTLAGRIDVRRPAAIAGGCLAPLYADFAGGSGSAWRAAWMLCAVLGVRAVGRHVFPSRVLCASLAIGWLQDGLVAFDVSFTLSIAATTGLLALGRRVDESTFAQASRWTEPRRPELPRALHTVAGAALTTLAATLPCVPLLLSLSPGLSLASVAANLLAAPLGEAVALPLCLLHALCSPLPALEHGVALVASGALALIRGVARASASVEWLYFELPPPHEWHLAAVVAGLSAGLAASGRHWLAAPAPSALARAGAPVASSGRARALGRHVAWSSTARTATAAGATLIALLAIELGTRWQHSAWYGRRSGRLRVTALDVGQGDATLVDLPDGRLMLIDGGGFVGVPIDPGERVILPTLRARRRDRVDILVLTHPHPDHYGGLLSVARHVAIGEFWYGEAEPPRAHRGHADEAPTHPGGTEHAPGSSTYRELLELLRQRGVLLRTAAELCAHGGRVDPLVQVLHPCPGVARDQEANDNSVVLRVTHGRHAALFVGDAERWAEQRLLATRADALGADFLKVGHHGSRTSSSPEFLARVRPTIATLSCGIRNRFGHPHPEALAQLEGVGARALRLDRSGGVCWESDGTTTSTHTFTDGVLEIPQPR